MKKILVCITDELFTLLQSLVDRTGRNALVESLLREHPQIENARKDEGVKWQERPVWGRKGISKKKSDISSKQIQNVSKKAKVEPWNEEWDK